MLDVLAVVFDDERSVRVRSSSAFEPVALGRRIAALYRCWERRSAIDLLALTEGFLDRLSDVGQPLRRTCGAAAIAVQAWGGHAYHSVRHHAEVATNAMILAELELRAGYPMSSRHRAWLLASCLSHDLYFQPAPHVRSRFAAEWISADALDRIAAECGLDNEDRTVLRSLILATEPSFRSTLADLVGGGATPSLPDELASLADRPDLCRLAALLSDADLLSSAGLTEGWHSVQVMRLQMEAGKAIGAADDEHFFTSVVGEDFVSVGGRHFSPNLVRIRRFIRLQHKPE